jgi:ABC-type transport system involved in multi-copper enzyme maturation permease subunit
MREFIATTHYEYLMQIRRPGLWTASLLLSGFVYFILFFDRGSIPADYLSQPWPWKLGAHLVGTMNMLMPAVAGILVAGCFTRDRQLRVTEILYVSALSTRKLALGKYLGALLGALAPSLAVTGAVVAWLAIIYQRPTLALTVPVALVVIALPSWLILVAWSQVFPLIVPLRVYQVALGGFWMWAVAVPTGRLPTINHTIVSIQGQYASYGFFFTGPTPFLHPEATPGWAILNITIITGLALLGLAALLVWQREQER